MVADRNPELLSRCLESLARNVGTTIPFETVVVLNGSAEPVVRFVRDNVRGAIVVESSVNRGVAGGYNLARAAARGDFVVLLHDDCEVWPGWLEALVGAADAAPEAGAVGSRALNADGSLQGGGAVIRADGTTELLLEDPDQPRAVDYCGSNSLLVRASTWDAVGGLDERFYPAYHVDVDFGTKVRAHGQVVLYEPRSQVTHHRWGVAVDGPFRVFAARRNLDRYVAKWLSGEGLEEEAPTAEPDYLRLDLALKDAYIAELEQQVASLGAQLAEIAASRTWRVKRFLTRLVTPSRRG